MKKNLLSIIIAFAVANAFAQAPPQMMSYQTVIRNTSGDLVQNTTVGMRISILMGSGSGTAVYVETQNPTTNVNGLASMAVGNGTVVSGTFAGINWSTGNYYIKTETDPSGGINYTITGTAQLLSVPYALYSAASSANLNGTPNHVIKFTPNGTTGGNSLIYDNGTNVLIGLASPNNPNDLFEAQSGVGNAVSGYSNSTYSGIYGSNSTTGTGVIGNSTSGSGVIGYGSNSSYGAVQGINYNLSGTGVVGGGNDLGSGGAYVFTGGSGGAFTGSQYGAIGYFSGANYPTAGGYFGNVVNADEVDHLRPKQIDH